MQKEKILTKLNNKLDRLKCDFHFHLRLLNESTNSDRDFAIDRLQKSMRSLNITRHRIKLASKS